MYTPPPAVTRFIQLLFVLLLLCGLTSCATPRLQAVRGSVQHAQLTPDAVLMDDGYLLPLSVWYSAQPATAIVLALHGFNDYRESFDAPARYLARHGVTSYAYDQRGFGETQQRGIWAGSDRLHKDAAAVAALLCQRYPDTPLYLVGESMGGAVVMDMLTSFGRDDCVAGVILVAPAVWGWQTMPVMQRSALRFLAHSFPGYAPTGSGLGVTASDNREMLHQQWLDPLVIKETRIDALFGLTNLMESALLASASIDRPALILYGERDEIIPPNATCLMLKTLPEQSDNNWRLVLYSEGYHMLTRDLQAQRVYDDMLAWLSGLHSSLPSAEEVTLYSPRLRNLCRE